MLPSASTRQLVRADKPKFSCGFSACCALTGDFGDAGPDFAKRIDTSPISAAFVEDSAATHRCWCFGEARPLEVWTPPGLECSQFKLPANSNRKMCIRAYTAWKGYL